MNKYEPIEVNLNQLHGRPLPKGSILHIGEFFVLKRKFTYNFILIELIKNIIYENFKILEKEQVLILVYNLSPRTKPILIKINHQDCLDDLFNNSEVSSSIKVIALATLPKSFLKKLISQRR